MKIKLIFLFLFSYKFYLIYLIYLTLYPLTALDKQIDLNRFKMSVADISSSCFTDSLYEMNLLFFTTMSLMDELPFSIITV